MVAIENPLNLLTSRISKFRARYHGRGKAEVSRRLGVEIRILP
jgi:hypothetical protein